MTKPSTYVITGASRGLGLELTKQLLQRGDAVVAAARNPSSSTGLQSLAKEHPKQLSFVTLDTADAASIKVLSALSSTHRCIDLLGQAEATFSYRAAGEELARSHPAGVDCLINNAGISGSRTRPIEQNVEDFRDILTVNILGPFLVVQAMLPLIRKGGKKQIVNMSSGLASKANLAANIKGEGLYPFAAKSGLAYRSSKAALCMESLSLAADLKDEGITVISMDPGWVKTDMGGPNADLEAPESIAGQLKVYDALTLEDTGKFYSYDGSIVPF